jgi:predicted small lipoprotein YifL
MKKILSLALIMVVLAASSCNRKGYCPAYDSASKVEKKA